MSDQKFADQRYSNQKPFIKRTFTLPSKRFLYMIVLIFLSLFIFYFKFMFTSDRLIIKLDQTSTKKAIASYPKVARTLYLFLCENQHEMNLYSTIFPTVSSDAIFYCWRENCNSSSFHPSFTLHTQVWSDHRRQRNEQLISLRRTSSSSSSAYEIQSRIFIINEKQLNRTKKGTWTTSRNDLYEYAMNEEIKQHWRWSYYIFVDGDVHLNCPLNQQLLTNRSIVDYGYNEEYLFASQYLSFVQLNGLIKNYSNPNENNEEKCYLLYDAFLLSISPAISTVHGAGGAIPYPGLLTQIVYHIDAMFNAVHRDALAFVLPYCSKYDQRTWWASQAVFVYRSLCLYGHIIMFDATSIISQKHRPYAKNGNPWATVESNLNLVPNHLLQLKSYMQTRSFVSPLILDHYSGWNIELTGDICRQNYTKMNVSTCLSDGN